AADPKPPRLVARHDATGGREDRRTHATKDPRYSRPLGVDTQAWSADPLQPEQHGLLLRRVAELNTQGTLALVFLHVEAANVAFFAQHARDVGLQARRRHHNTAVARGHGVTHPREHISNRVGHHIVLLRPTSSISPRPAPRPAALARGS